MSSGAFHRRVAQRFAGATASYDAHSAAQRHAARQLARRIVIRPAAASTEITGPRNRLRHRPSDRVAGAPPARRADPRHRHRAGDGCRLPRPAGATQPSDLRDHGRRTTCRCRPVRPDLRRNLVAQWFDDLPGACARLTALLAPGGVLALCLPGGETFREWRAAHARLDSRPARWPCRRPGACRAALPAGGARTSKRNYWLDRPPGGLDFLRALRAIGANTPAPGHVPLSPAQLRRVLRELGTTPALTYELIYLFWQREDVNGDVA